MQTTTALEHYVNLAWIAWFRFLIHYRRTLLGPLWLLVGPALFIAIIGPLFSHVSGIATSVFLPYLAIGLVCWNFIQGAMIGGTTVFVRSRAQILQGELSLIDLATIDLMTVVLQSLHQALIIVAIFLIFEPGIGLYGFVSLIGLAFLIINGVWVTIVFGIIGARYRDLSELVQAIMRIAFLATPIIWMPGSSAQGGVMGVYLVLNPFYHFVEIVRAPLLGTPIAPMSWAVVVAVTVIGIALTQATLSRYARFVPLWI